MLHIKVVCFYFYSGYFAWTWNAICGELDREQLRLKTVVHTCASHFVHRLATNLKNVKLNVEERHFIFRAFAASMTFVDYKEFKDFLRDVLILWKREMKVGDVCVAEENTKN